MLYFGNVKLQKDTIMKRVLQLPIQFKLLKDLASSQSVDLISNIIKWKDISKEELQVLKKLPSSLNRTLSHFIQDKLTTIPSIDCDQSTLLSCLQTIQNIFYPQVTFFVISLLNKIQNAKLFITTVEKYFPNNQYEENNTYKDINLRMRQLERIRKIATKQYNYLIGNCQGEEDYTYQSKRVEKLTQQDRMELQLRCIILMQKIPIQGERLAFNDERYIKLFPDPKYKTFAKYFVQLQTQKIIKISNCIKQMQLVQLDGKVQLNHNNEEPILHQFINEQVISQIYFQAKSEDEHKFFSSLNYIVTESEIYFKYNLFRIFSKRNFYIFTEGRHSRQINAGRKQKCKTTINQFGRFISILINSLIFSKKIMIFTENKEFRQLTQNESKKLNMSIFRLINQFLQNARRQEMLSNATAVFRNQQFISNIFKLCEIDQQSSSTQSLPVRLLKILNKIIADGTNDINLLNNQMIIANLTSLFSKIDINIKNISVVQYFLKEKLTKLKEFGLNPECLPLPKLFQFKFKSMFQNSTDEHIFQEQEDSLFYRQEQGSGKLDSFFIAFPDSIAYFKEQLKQKIKIIKERRIFCQNEQHQQMSQFISVIIIYEAKYLQSDEQLDLKMIKIIQQSKIYRDRRRSIQNIKNKISKYADKKLQQTSEAVIKLIGDGQLFDQMEIQQFCQKKESDNQKLNDFGIKIQSFIFWLNFNNCKVMNQQFIKQLIGLQMKMEVVQSKIYNRIVNYQTNLDNQKLIESHKFYKQLKKDDSSMLYKKIQTQFEYVKQAIEEYLFSYPIYNQFLTIQLQSIKLNYLKMTDDKNLILTIQHKLLNLMRRYDQRFVGSISFYNYLKEELLANIQNLFITYEIPRTLNTEIKINLGADLIKFIIKKKEQGKNPTQQFKKVLTYFVTAHLSKQFISIFNFSQKSATIFLNGYQYKGSKNYANIKANLQLDVIQTCSKKLNSQNAVMYFNIIKILTVYEKCQSQRQKLINRRLNRQDMNAVEQSTTFHPQIPKGYHIQIFDQNQIQKHLDQAYHQLSNRIFDIQYTTDPLLNKIMYALCIKKIKNKQLTLREKIIKIQTITEELKNILSAPIMNKQKIKDKCMWLGIFLNQSDSEVPLSISKYFDAKLINKFLAFNISIIEQHSQQYKQFLQTTLRILQKITPTAFPNKNPKFDTYIKIISSFMTQIIKQINQKDKFYLLYQIGVKMSQNYRQQFGELIKLITNKLLINQSYNQVLTIIDKLVQNDKMNLIEMEADIKTYFLKISEEVTSEQAEYYITNLQKFIDSFKSKYKDNILELKNLASKFLKKKNKDQDSSVKICLAYDKRQKFAYSQMAKQQFVQIQPLNIVKVIISAMIENGNAIQEKDINNKLKYLQEIISIHPFLLPYILFHKIDFKGRKMSYIDSLIERISEKQSKIQQFLLFCCLDHSFILQNKNKTILFSQYLCWIILKQIASMTLTRDVLYLILNMVQLKRFNYLCKIRTSKSTQSLKGRLQNELIQICNGDVTNPKFHNNLIIIQILTYIYQYDQIDNLKLSYIQKREADEQYSLINQCLIPFRSCFIDNEQSQNRHRKRESRQKIVAYLGSVNIPALFEQYQLINLEQQFIGFISEANYQQNVEIKSDCKNEIWREKHSDQIFECIQLMDKKQVEIKKMKTIAQQLFFTQKRQIFQFRINRIKKHLVQQTLKSNQDDQSQDQFQMMMINAMRRQSQREHLNQLPGRGQRRGRGRGRKAGQRHVSKYAPEDFKNLEEEDVAFSKLNQIKNQFTQSLTQIQQNPSQLPKQTNEIPQFSSFEQYNQQEQHKLQQLIQNVNRLHNRLSKPEISIQEIKHMNISQKIEHLSKLQADAQFQYLSETQTQNQIVKHFDQHPEKQKYLSQKKANTLDHYNQIAISMSLQRQWSLGSSESQKSFNADDLIDALQGNYMKFTKGFSRKQSIEQDFNDEELSSINQKYPFQNITLSPNVFPDFQQKVLLAILSNLNIFYTLHSNRILIPLLQNKKIQNKLLNSLILILKNPVNNQFFKKPAQYWDSQQKKWIKFNQIQAEKKIKARIMIVIKIVKNCCYYKNPEFLTTPLNLECFGDICLSQNIQFQAFNDQNTYKPNLQLLKYALNKNIELAASLIKGVSNLTQKLIKQILKYMKNPIPIQQHIRGRGYFMNQEQLKQINICDEFIINLNELFKSQYFKELYFAEFPIDSKYPHNRVMATLIDSNLYTPIFWKEYHLKMLSKFVNENQKQDFPFSFFNKVFSLYTKQELCKKTELHNYQELYVKVIKFLSKSRKRLQKQPISIIFDISEMINLQMKQKIISNAVSYRFRDIQSQMGMGMGMGTGMGRPERIVSKRKVGIFESAFYQLKSKPTQFWYKSLSVEYMDENGMIQRSSGSGVVVDWMSWVTKQMVNHYRGLFYYTSQNYYFIHPASMINPRNRQCFQFIGKLLAKCFLSQRLFIYPSFIIFLYKYILDQQMTFSDLFQYSDDFKQDFKKQTSLKYLIECQDKQLLDQMYLFFCYDKETSFINADTRFKTINNNGVLSIERPPKGQHDKNQFITLFLKTIQEKDENGEIIQQRNEYFISENLELIPNGRDIQITLQNKEEFIKLRKNKFIQQLIEPIKQQLKALKNGFLEIIPIKYLKMIKAEQLRLIIEGQNKIERDDLKMYMNYAQYESTDNVIVWFWEIVYKLSVQQLSNLILFWTGTPKVCPGGFKQARPRLKIAKIQLKGYYDHLHSHTCFNIIDIPCYQTKQQLQSNIKMIIDLTSKGLLTLQG